MKIFGKVFGAEREPRLVEAYVVCRGDEVVAALEEPEVEDQFWVSFRLRPMGVDDAVVYVDGAWGDGTLVIREKASQRVVVFALALDWDETEDEVVARSVLEGRPERVLLRGPYRADVLAG